MSDETADGGGSESPGGPDIGPPALHADQPTPPQLENGEGWAADPLLVSGCEAYVEGEYLYQDYVYDDHGADTRSVLEQPPGGETLGGFYCRPTGDLRYPTAPDTYAFNGADLLELRARPTADGVAYRITLNTMLEPDAAAIAIGIDTSAGEADDGRTDWGYGLGELGASVDHRLVTWGTGAELDGDPLEDDRVTVDVRRNQIEVEVPLDPEDETWRHYCVTGLWNAEDGRFQEVSVDADREVPGGGKRGMDVPPVFNVGFRFEEPLRRNIDIEELLPRLAMVVANAPMEVLQRLDEPLQLLGLLGDAPKLFDIEDPLGLFNPLEDPLSVSELVGVANRLSPFSEAEAVPRSIGIGNWREHGQATALAARDISQYHADIDFETLRAEETDRRVPDSGFITYLYPSAHEFGEGVDPYANVLEGRIQPYGVYVPEDLEEPAPMVTMLHSLGNCYTQYPAYMPTLVENLAEETGGIVFMPQTRGPGIWYKKKAELDVFEAWRNLETRVDIDRERVSVTGYSMGGFGAIIMATKNPDTFGRCFGVVGPPAEDPLQAPTNNMIATPSLLMNGLFGGEDGGELFSIFTEKPENALRLTENLRHVPMLLWHGGTDPLVPLLGPTNYARELREHGYRHQIDVFPSVDHFALAIQDSWDRGPSYLSPTEVPKHPSRVTYRRVPEFDYPELGIVHDSAYWVTDIDVREGHGSGLVDAISLADGYGDPTPERFTSSGTKPMPYTATGIEWADPVDVRGPENTLEVTLEGVESVTLWVEAAGLDPETELTVEVDSDVDATLTLRGSFGAHDVEIEAGTSTVEVDPLA